MKFVFTTMGTRGDLFPHLGIARQLKQRGHDVHIVSNGVYKQTVEQTGIPFTSIDDIEAYERLEQHPDTWNCWKYGAFCIRQFVVPRMEKSLAVLLDFASRGDVVFVGNSSSIAGRMVHEISNAPYVTVHLQPYSIASIDRPPLYLPIQIMPQWITRPGRSLIYSLVHAVIDRLHNPELSQLRSKYKLPRVRRVLDWLNSPQQVFCFWPSWFAAKQADWPAKSELLGFPYYDVDPLLDKNECCVSPQSIVFTAGTGMTRASHFFLAAVDACRKLGLPGILVARHSSQIPDKLPDGVRHRTYVPFSKLLPNAAAIVHHGGIGTCAQAFAAGIPQLVTPIAFDQFDNASRIRNLGAGDYLSFNRITGNRMAQAIQRLINSSKVRETCSALKETIDRDKAISNAADLLIKFADKTGR